MLERLHRNLWLLMIPVLLLAAGLAAQRLAGYPLDVNEEPSKLLAGGMEDGPYRFAEVLASISENSPDQAYGLPLFNSLWARALGWSEFALRLVPLYAGLLAIAWVYRAGRDCFAPRVGLVAALFLTTSVFFITFMHVARAFSLVALFVTMVFWGYWRIALRPPAGGPGRGTQFLFVLGNIGVFYSHYFAVFLPLGLTLWHLLFVRKDRLWWRPVLLWALAAVAFLPQLSGFLQGIGFTQTMPWFTGYTMWAPEVSAWFLYVLTNGIINIPETVIIWLLVVAALAAAAGIWIERRRKPLSLAWLLPFTLLVVLAMMLVGNEIVQVMTRFRLRYFIALWPFSALLAGWVVWRSRGRWRWVVGVLLAAWVVNGLWLNLATERRFEFYELLYRYPVAPAIEETEKYASQQDLLILHGQLGYWGLRPSLPENQLRFSDAGPEISDAIHDHLRVWVLVAEWGMAEVAAVIAPISAAKVLCDRFVDEQYVVLELYTGSPAHCPNDEPPLMRFGEEEAAIELAASALAVGPWDTLNVDLLLRSESNTAMTAYSVAVHVFSTETGEKVAQGDQGLWLGRYNALHSEFDIRALAAGEYEVRIGLYNWQTLERLPGVDLMSGTSGQLLSLARFRVG